MIRPERRTYVVVVRWADELLSGKVQMGVSILGAVHLHSVDRWALSGLMSRLHGTEQDFSVWIVTIRSNDEVTTGWTILFKFKLANEKTFFTELTSLKKFW